MPAMGAEAVGSETAGAEAAAGGRLSLFLGGGGLARREKFPEICSDRHDMGTSDPLKIVSDTLETT